MFNSKEGVSLDGNGDQHISGAIRYTDLHADFQMLISINNELAISNMLAAINNPEIQQKLKEMEIYDKTVLSIAKYIEANVLSAEKHNEFVDEADSKGYYRR